MDARLLSFLCSLSSLRFIGNIDKLYLFDRIIIDPIVSSDPLTVREDDQWRTEASSPIDKLYETMGGVCSDNSTNPNLVNLFGHAYDIDNNDTFDAVLSAAKMSQPSECMRMQYRHMLVI